MKNCWILWSVLTLAAACGVQNSQSAGMTGRVQPAPRENREQSYSGALESLKWRLLTMQDENGDYDPADISLARAQRKANVEAANARRLSSLSSEDKGFQQFCSAHARKCPSCHVIIWRHSGCDHMTCKCGREFDWNKDEAAKIGGSHASPQPVQLQSAQPVSPLPLGTDELSYRRVPEPRTRSEEEAQLAAAIAASHELYERDRPSRSPN